MGSFGVRVKVGGLLKRSVPAQGGERGRKPGRGP